MDEILHQLGGLLLGSVPTIILFLLIVSLYRVLVYTPLTRVLNERRSRTAGAVVQANQAIATAEAKAQEYDAKLRAARLKIFEDREQRLRQWSTERETALAEAREAAQRRIAEAKASLAQEAQDAHRTLESSAETLAREVIRTFLPSDAASNLAAAGSAR
jgi:F-type H+-transporting ATPase subunit b